MSEPVLTLRPTVIGGETAEGDYSVRRDGRTIGRIRAALDHVSNKPVWEWTITIPLPVPPWAKGQSDSFDRAKESFRAAWERFYVGLSETDVALWHRTEDARRLP